MGLAKGGRLYVWQFDCPKEIGWHNFLTEYSKLYPERVESYAKGHWELTQDLIKDGRGIVDRTNTKVRRLRSFLWGVARWKNPGRELPGIIDDINKNSDECIKAVFEDALELYRNYIKDKEEIPEDAERRLINIFGRLYAFGRVSGSRKMVSAILRLLDPTKYGTVDYRNWAILSNTEHQFVEKPMLESLAGTWKESKGKNIDTEKYFHYLKIIRILAKDYNMTPAEVDMALFAYSDEKIPLGR